MTLSPEPATSEPESVSSASSTSIGPSGMDPPGNVGGGSRFQIPLDSKLSFLATVGLGVSDFVYRIFGFSEICSFRISHNRMAMRPHGKKQCPKKSVYILLFALQLLFSRFISFRAIASFFRPPTPACIYIYSYVVTPGHIE